MREPGKTISDNLYGPYHGSENVVHDARCFMAAVPDLLIFQVHVQRVMQRVGMRTEDFIRLQEVLQALRAAEQTPWWNEINALLSGISLLHRIAERFANLRHVLDANPPPRKSEIRQQHEPGGPRIFARALDGLARQTGSDTMSHFIQKN